MFYCLGSFNCATTTDRFSKNRSSFFKHQQKVAKSASKIIILPEDNTQVTKKKKCTRDSEKKSNVSVRRHLREIQLQKCDSESHLKPAGLASR